MHHRGRVSTPEGEHIRASVWVEQEVAIAAFLLQARGRMFEKPLAYVQRGIKLEGLREKIMLNPVGFDSSDEVVKDLGNRLDAGLFAVKKA